MLSLSELFVLTGAGLLGALVILAFCLYAAIKSEIISYFELAESRRREDLRGHQKWLFNQLYSMSPGKVLRPDEMAHEVAKKPASIFSPTEDGMAEFTGMKDDFHG